MKPLLEGVGLRKSYGGVPAVDAVSLSVRRGTVHGLIGPNGAGKTTLFNLLAGTVAPDAGRVLFRGHDIPGWPPHRVARLGLTRTFQVARGLGRRSVLESIPLADPDPAGERPPRLSVPSRQ